MKQRPIFSFAVFIAAVVLTSCNSLHEMRGTLQEVQTVHQELVKSLGYDDIRVGLINSRFLNIVAVNSPWKALPAIEKAAKALQIARLGYVSYPSRSTLSLVGVTFGVHRSYLGIFSFDDATDSFRFTIPQLTAATSDPRGNGANQ
jgi:hypothetical protein